MAKRTLPKVCHCGSGKFPGILRPNGGWCCGECHNDRNHCAVNAERPRPQHTCHFPGSDPSLCQACR